MERILYLFLNPTLELFSHSSHAVHINETVNALRNIRCEVEIYTPGERESKEKSRQKFQTLKRIMPNRLANTLRDLWKIRYDKSLFHTLKTNFAKNNFGFIYERYTDLCSAGQKLAKHLNIPHIVESNAPTEEFQIFGTASWLFTVSRARHIAVMNNADAVVAVSSCLKDYYTRLGVDGDKIFVLPNGVNSKVFRAGNYENTSLRNKYGLNEKIVVGFVGSIRVYHGFESIVTAADIILKDNRDIFFLIVGGGDGLEQSKMELARLGITRNFIFAGYVPNPEIPSFLGAMDICIMPNSNWYGSPMKLFEYAAMGKAMIAPRLGPVMDVFRDGEHVILITPGDARELASKLLYLARHPQRRQTLGENAMKRVYQHYTWDKNAERILCIYNWIKKDKKPEERPNFEREILLEHE